MNDTIREEIHDEDTDILDFSMLDLPSRPGPCRAARALECDPVEARIHRDAAAAQYRAAARRSAGPRSVGP